MESDIGGLVLGLIFIVTSIACPILLSRLVVKLLRGHGGVWFIILVPLTAAVFPFILLNIPQPAQVAGEDEEYGLGLLLQLLAIYAFLMGLLLSCMTYLRSSQADRE
jgi:H+/gluconate symporter-like permease